MKSLTKSEVENPVKAVVYNSMLEFLGCANLLWSTKGPDKVQLRDIVSELLPGIAGT
jgi:hypothetical protein